MFGFEQAWCVLVVVVGVCGDGVGFEEEVHFVSRRQKVVVADVLGFFVVVARGELGHWVAFEIKVFEQVVCRR